MEPTVHSVFHPPTSTWQYIVACPATRDAVIIDPVLDFDPASLTVSTRSADDLLDLAASHGYKIVRLLETHAHADHLTAAYYLQKALLAAGQPRAPICIGQQIRTVQETFGRKYRIPPEELNDTFDHLFADEETFSIGNLTAKVLHLPGHTPDHIGYMVGENVFTGDSIFNPDVGSARCDFPDGDARALYRSMKKLLSLPSHYRLYTGHDYPPASSRDPVAFVTVAEQRERNKHVGGDTPEEQFVQWRTERDRGLNEPRLLHPALQVNVRGGRMPRLAGDGRAFLQLPVQVPAMLE